MTGYTKKDRGKIFLTTRLGVPLKVGRRGESGIRKERGETVSLYQPGWKGEWSGGAVAKGITAEGKEESKDDVTSQRIQPGRRKKKQDA